MFDPARVSDQARDYRLVFPHPGGRALHPDACRWLGQAVRVLAPARILELGSGFSSLLIAAELAGLGAGHVHSVDHSARWSAIAGSAVHERGLDGRITFHVFPLRLRRYGRVPCVFYGIPAQFHEPRGPYDLVFVDGPGHEVGRDGAMFEAFPHVRLGGWIVLDDLNAAHVQASLARWRRAFGIGLRVTACPEVGNGIGIVQKVAETMPRSPAFPAVQWLRAARNLARLHRRRP
jgi:predicted O-methyltransferase YrrM